MTDCKTQGFIDRARLIHGGRYSYERTSYTNKRSPVTVTCNRHGDFEVLANSHLHGRKPSGCPRCSGKQVLTEDFVDKAKNIHGDAYDYSISNYRGATTPLDIICPTHGVFSQKPCEHNRVREGRPPTGCPTCGNLRISNSNKDTLQAFIRKARVVHNEFYDYSKIDYINSRTKVVITCPNHGDFEQKAAHHLEGSGCPGCYTPGYFCESFFSSHPDRKKDPAVRYFVKLAKDGEEFIKVGITTTSVEKRFTSDAHDVEILDLKYGSLYDCFHDEQNILKNNSEFKYVPTNRLLSGNTECLDLRAKI